MKIRRIALWLLLCCMPAYAGVEVAGVGFEPSVKVGADGTVLNGVGVRRVLFFKAYALALYLPQRSGASYGALSMPGGKRLRMVCLREISAEQFVNALNEGLKKNLDEKRMLQLFDRLERFKQTLIEQRTAAKGADITLDWLPQTNGGVTRLSIDGKVRGEDIPGEDFFQALLSIWLGDNPPALELKDALLGKMP